MNNSGITDTESYDKSTNDSHHGLIEVSATCTSINHFSVLSIQKTNKRLGRYRIDRIEEIQTTNESFLDLLHWTKRDPIVPH
jgi:hypothetical protein